MDFTPSPLQRELAAATRDLLERHCPPAVVRAAAEQGPAEHEGPGPLWRALVELGLPGALLPGSVGGLGLGVSDLLPALVETGRAAVPAPIVETAVVAVPLLVAAGRVDLAAAVAAGRTVLSAAPAGEPVAWAGASDLVLVLGDDARLVATDEPGSTPVPAVDRSRPLTRLDRAGDVLTADADLVRAARSRAALGAAAQLIGLAERQLEMTVGHVARRRQFGVPVGSFQAVKHQLADALLGVRFAEPAVRGAGIVLDAGETSAGPAVALAKALASDAADLVSRTAIQCHGAIGYSHEYDLQLYAKRTWALAAAWGTAGEHRAAYGDALGLPAGR